MPAHTYPLFKPVQLGERKEVSGALAYRTYDAGHMLGSTAMIVEADNVRLAFSGDVGRVGIPIIRDPQPLDAADYLIMECTYGDRLHAPIGHAEDKLADVVNRTAARGGKIIVPCFRRRPHAAGRADAPQLIEAKRVPSIPCSSTALWPFNVTEVYRKHANVTTKRREDSSLKMRTLRFSRLTYVREASESKKAQRSPRTRRDPPRPPHVRSRPHPSSPSQQHRGPAQYYSHYRLSGSLHAGPKNSRPPARSPIFGQPMPLRAEVVSLEELSGHADQHELIEWMRPFAKGLKKVFLVHGEPDPVRPLAALITKEYGIEAHMPARGERASRCSGVLSPDDLLAIQPHSAWGLREKLRIAPS